MPYFSAFAFVWADRLHGSDTAARRSAEWASGKRFATDASKESVFERIDTLDIPTTEMDDMKVIFTIGATKLSATLVENNATAALRTP